MPPSRSRRVPFPFVDWFRRYFRLIRIRLSAAPGSLGLHDVGIVRDRVWLSDIDELRHTNNSVYLGLMDHARFDLMQRSGAWQKIRAAKIYPVVTTQTITYRKSLELGDRFTIETRIAGYDEKSVYIEQRFVRDGEITARAIVAGRFLRDAGGTVTMAELGEVTGVDVTARRIPAWMADWAAATKLPGTREPAPSSWD
jgi:YbgC/YbaW family acyl-CoA thioester hydrolase